MYEEKKRVLGLVNVEPASVVVVCPEDELEKPGTRE